ncbi:S24 family peptidase [Eikenella longinqua]|uniref:S24 family peptidase n=1 Tax=Eikenella longinqua TaxID=1795827 RepID=UPI001FE2081A|nr:S24 family peptidase [Eikenella longinqua]
MRQDFGVGRARFTTALAHDFRQFVPHALHGVITWQGIGRGGLVAVSAGHGAWADDIPPKSTLAFRRDWLEAFVTTDFNNLSVVMVKGDSMAGVLNDKDAILVDHSRTEASDGLYALRIGNEIFVKRVQRLPHALLVTSENPQYKPFEVPLQNGDSSDSSVSIIGKVVWLGRAL